MPWRHWVCLAVVAGALAGALAPMDARLAWAGALAALSMALAMQRSRMCWLLVALTAASAAHATVARGEVLMPPLARRVAEEPLAGAAGSEARTVTPLLLRGIVVEDAVPAGGEVRLLIDVERVRATDRQDWQDTAGRVQVVVAGTLSRHAVREWTAGRRFQAPVLLRRVHAWRNPGMLSPQRQTLSRGVALAGTIKSAALVEIERGPWWTEGAARARAIVRNRTSRWIDPIDPLSAAVVTAILIGDRAGLPPETVARLQTAGTYHVIAISGGNVALVVLLALGLVRLAARGHAVRTITAVTILVAYRWVVGDDPSVTRAVTAAAVYLACRGAGLSAAPADVLGLVVLIVLLREPLLVLDVGAWLSFGAVTGILLGAAPLAAGFSRGGGRVAKWTTGRAARGAVSLFCATVAVEVMLLPVNAAVFSRLGVAGLVLNFVAIPAMAVVQVAGLVLIGVADWWDAAARLAAVIAHLGVRALVGSAALLDVAPWLSWRVPPPAPVTVLAFYTAGVLALSGRLPRGRPQLVATVTAAGAAAVILTAPAVELSAPPRGWLRATMLDVGQGEAMVVQFPAGRSLLVDAGGVPGGFDVGGRVIAPSLWALGVRRLDWLAFTHADLDHVQGARAVAEIMRPHEIWEGVPVPPDARRLALSEFARRRGIAWRQLQRGDRLEVGGVTLEVLHPPPADWERQRVRNEDSLVMQLRYGDVELLLTGDIGQATEAALTAPGGSDAGGLRVLKVAHHGSRTSSSAEFLARVQPNLALISAGRGNPYGHPAADVTGRLRAAGAELFRTDTEGAIQVETNGRQVRVTTEAGRRRGFTAWPVAAVGVGTSPGSSALSVPRP